MLLLTLLLSTPSTSIASQIPFTQSHASSSPPSPPFNPLSHTQNYEFNPLLHLPGISPYFDAVGFGLSHAVPIGCNVTAASYLVRHAAIYANDDDWEQYLQPFLALLPPAQSHLSSSFDANENVDKVEQRQDGKNGKKEKKGWTGPLEFLERWKSPITDPEAQMEQITPSGRADAVKVGKHLLARYPALVPTTSTIYADKKARTHDTATSFVKAFPHADEISVVVIKRDDNGDMDSQIPHKSCPAFSKDPGDQELAAIISFFAPRISARLVQYLPSSITHLTNAQIIGMMQMCGYESAITGKKSELCNIFTDAEWMAYEYAWDVKYAYMVGPENPLSPYLGFPWLNTTAALFDNLPNTMPQIPGDDPHDKNGRKERKGKNGNKHGKQKHGQQRFFLSFTHREVPPFVITALGLFNSSSKARESLPLTSINWSRSWKMAELIPFLGHVGIEKMTCSPPSPPDKSKPTDGRDEEQVYVRVISNSAPRPIPNCQDGPGASCGMSNFRDLVGKGMREFGDFHGVCGKAPKGDHPSPSPISRR